MIRTPIHSNLWYKGLMVFVICILFSLFIPQTISAKVIDNFEYEVIEGHEDEARILGYMGAEEEVYIPKKIDNLIVTEIAEGAFYGNNNVEQVIIEAPITTIGEDAFSGCRNLVYVDLKKTELKTIEAWAFGGCVKLDNLILPDTLVTIGERAFMGCTRLTYVQFGKGLKVLEQMAFANCTNLKEANLPDSIEQLYSSDKTGVYGGVFYGCSNLETVSLGQKIKNIPDNTFYGCSKLNKVVIPNSVTEIGERAFAKCIALTSIRLSNQLLNIGQGAFYYCTGLTSITFPDSLLTIASSQFSEETRTFGRCTNLTSVILGSGMTSIPPYLFWGCTNLSSVTIPSNIIFISDGAFKNCKKLQDVYFMGNIPVLDTETFKETNSKLMLNYTFGADTKEAKDYKLKLFDVSKNYIPIYFNTNDGEDSVTYLYVQVGRTMSEPIPPTRKGYSFDGWAVNPEGSGNTWDFSSMAFQSKLTFYAKWKVNYYNITFNPQGGSLLNKKKKVAYDQELGKLPVPTRADYKFAGWFTKINGDGEEYTHDMIMGDKNITLYADWKLSPTAPGAPKVVGSEYSATKIKLLWNKVPNVSGYDIYRADSLNGRYTKIGSASAAASGYINAKLTKGKTYYYKVKAYRTLEGQKFYSGYSAKIKVTITGKPATPDLKVLKKSENSTDLTWGRVEDADGIDVYYKTKATDEFKKFASYGGNIVGCYHQNLTKGKSYYYRVRAYAVVNGKKIYSSYSTTKKVILK